MLRSLEQDFNGLQRTKLWYLRKLDVSKEKVVSTFLNYGRLFCTAIPIRSPFCRSSPNYVFLIVCICGLANKGTEYENKILWPRTV